MPKLALEVDMKELEQIIDQLRPGDRISLIRRLEQRAWGERLRAVLSEIDRKRKKKTGKISQKEVLKLVKAARQERYAASRS